MNTFFETAETNPSYDIDVALSEFAMESADIERRINLIDNTYNVNIACAQHKVLTESGCYDDLELLFEAAENEKQDAQEGIMASIGKSINNLFTRFKNWMMKKSAVDESKRAADQNPNANLNEDGNAVPDPSFISVFLRFITLPIRQLINKIIAKNNPDIITGAIDDIKASGDKKAQAFIDGHEGMTKGVVAAGACAKALSNAASESTSLVDSINAAMDKVGSDANWLKKTGAAIRGFCSWLVSIITKVINKVGGVFAAGWHTILGIGKNVGDKVKGAIDKSKQNKKDKAKNEKTAAVQADVNNNIQDKNQPAPNNSAPTNTAPNNTQNTQNTKESVNIMGIDFDTEDYTLESAFDNDYDECAALLDIF